MLTKEEINKIITNNESLFDNIYIFHQKFDIIPKKLHRGVSIKYMDLMECRKEFVDELIYTITDWVYSQTKQKEILKTFVEDESRSEHVAHQKLTRLAFSKFRRSDDDVLIQGQFGELLLFVFLQKLFNAVPVMRKMPLTTSIGHERFGSDAIHYCKENHKHIFYLGEAKSYESKYKFKQAFSMSISSILDTWDNHVDELDLYIYDGFLEPDLLDIVSKYKNKKLDNCEVQLVCLVAYNETEKLIKSNATEIKKQINNIIQKRYREYNEDILYKSKNPLINRINYILFPIWEFDKLLNEIKKLI